VRGVRVIANVTYCGHTIQVVAELNRQGQWTGRGIVVGRAFEGRLPLTAPLPTPTAALDTTLAAGRRCVDERRGGNDHQEGSGPTATPRTAAPEGTSLAPGETP
jgi:hypothetical protein